MTGKEWHISQLCACVCVCAHNHSAVFDSLRPYRLSPPGSSVHGILQARILEWVANPFSRGSSRPNDQTQVSCIAGRFLTIWTFDGKVMQLREWKWSFSVRLSATPWPVAFPSPLSMEFSRQEYWSGLPIPSPGDLPNPGIEPKSPTLQADSLPSEPPG